MPKVDITLDIPSEYCRCQEKRNKAQLHTLHNDNSQLMISFLNKNT